MGEEWDRWTGKGRRNWTFKNAMHVKSHLVLSQAWVGLITHTINSVWSLDKTQVIHEGRRLQHQNSYFIFFPQYLKTYKCCQYFKYISSKNRFMIRISCSTASHNPILSMLPCIIDWVNWCTCSWALVPRPYNPKKPDVAHLLEWIPKQNMKLPVLLHISWVKFRE